jgi:chloramphenicol 3-O-phosphotransferase
MGFFKNLSELFVLYNKCVRLSSQGTLLLLDGPSSAGKTSICQKLYIQFQDLYKTVGIDEFIIDVFDARRKLKISEEELVIQCNSRVSLMYEKIRDYLFNGTNIICDTTLTCLGDENSVGPWFEKLKNLNGFLIFVYCPLHILAERVTLRNVNAFSTKNPDNARSVVITLYQFNVMLKKRTSESELLVDILTRDQVEYACHLVKNSFGHDEAMMKRVRFDILSRFKLLYCDSVYITPALNYDFIVNTSHYSPNECVECIKSHIEKKSKITSAIEVNCKKFGLMGALLIVYKNIILLVILICAFALMFWYNFFYSRKKKL